MTSAARLLSTGDSSTSDGQLSLITARDAPRRWMRGRTAEGSIGAVLLTLMVMVAVVGPWVAPFSPTQTAVGPALSGSTSHHLLGTDDLGRDVLSRLLCGGLSLLGIPAIGTVVAVVTGALIGMTAGYLGGWFDTVIARILDVLLALPAILVVLVIVVSFGGDITVLIVSLVLVFSPQVARVVRGATMDLRTRDFVVAAQARKDHLSWIIGRELFPNLAPFLLVETAVRFTFAVSFIATLNFLGLGVQPPNPNWGLMVSEGRNFITQAPLTALAPTAAIAALIISIHLIADALAVRYRNLDPGKDAR